MDLVVLPRLIRRRGANDLWREVGFALHGSGRGNAEEFVSLFGERVGGVVSRHFRL